MPRSSDPFPPGISNSQINSYQLIRTLGTGAFGRAILSFHPSAQKYYVLKKIDILKSKSNGTDVFLEARLLGKVNHRNVVALKEWFVEGKWLYLVTEFAECGDLYELIQSRKGKLFSESTIMTWFIQLCWGLEAVHENKLLHRDIKTKNIFLSNCNRRIILGDFGIAKLLHHPQEFATTVIGTPYYLSPEICKNIPYNSKSDVWALGCVLYEICTLKHPFNGKSMDELVGNIIGKRPLDIPSCYNPALMNLVNQMLNKDPRLRPSVSDILRKPFMQLWVQKIEFILREIPKAPDLENRQSIESIRSPAYKRSMHNSNAHRHPTSRQRQLIDCPSRLVPQRLREKTENVDSPSLANPRTQKTRPLSVPQNSQLATRSRERKTEKVKSEQVKRVIAIPLEYDVPGAPIFIVKKSRNRKKRKEKVVSARHESPKYYDGDGKTAQESFRILNNVSQSITDGVNENQSGEIDRQRKVSATVTQKDETPANGETRSQNPTANKEVKESRGKLFAKAHAVKQTAVAWSEGEHTDRAKGPTLKKIDDLKKSCSKRADESDSGIGTSTENENEMSSSAKTSASKPRTIMKEGAHAFRPDVHAHSASAAASITTIPNRGLEIKNNRQNETAINIETGRTPSVRSIFTTIESLKWLLEDKIGLSEFQEAYELIYRYMNPRTETSAGEGRLPVELRQIMGSAKMERWSGVVVKLVYCEKIEFPRIKLE